MPKETKITCECCGEDLTTTGKMPKFRLVLKGESIPHNTGVRYMVMVYPDIDYDCYFCDLKCVGQWAIKKGAQ